MRIFDLLAIQSSEVSPDISKVHLATSDGPNNPLHLYFADKFNEWQQWQSKKNFERQFVVSLIAMPESNQWLLAGVYRSCGCEWIESKEMYQYQLRALPEYAEVSGRLVAEFVRRGRQSYLNAENWTEKIILSQFHRKKLSIGRFPGYRMVNLSRLELETVVSNSLESWRTALSSVAGIYLIADTVSGQLYVGSASGEGGIWQRWSNYVATGHGGNVALRALMGKHGRDRVRSFCYSVLEIADIHMSKDDVLVREGYWKKILLSHAHGLNAN